MDKEYGSSNSPPPPAAAAAAAGGGGDVTMQDESLSPATNRTNQPTNPAATTTTTTTTTTPPPVGQSKVMIQMNKLKEANNKYKNLLKLAKDRITKQEEEMEAMKAENKRIKEQQQQQNYSDHVGLSANGGHTKVGMSSEDNNGNNNNNNNNGNNAMISESDENSSNIVRVCQRIQEGDTLWALFEFEIDPSETTMTTPQPSYLGDAPIRYQKWKRFDSEATLQDYIRRDTGEPLVVPPLSLSPTQSHDIQQEAKRQVSQITEEFRRFRVRSEVQRKQTDAHIRDLQSNNVATAKRRIEGEDLEKELELARSDHAQLELLRNELAAQEAQWKEAYDVLVAENNSLRASGSEALLAAQWRQRYEHLLAEKEDLESRLQMEVEKAEVAADQRRKIDAGKYELKYRDLKESFRLYRKKAKEIFEAQQRGDVGLLNIAERSSEDAKLSYIRNLMVNYLSSDVAVREHMEGAIGTVLKFTQEDIQKIEKKKQENEAWF